MESGRIVVSFSFTGGVEATQYTGRDYQLAAEQETDAATMGVIEARMFEHSSHLSSKKEDLKPLKEAAARMLASVLLGLNLSDL
ncbi:hypothetical protein ACLOJK_024715 [Asimina triloba]